MFKISGLWINVPLGDALEKALAAVGITSERVERLLGFPCGCKWRRDKLNALDNWARRILSGKTEDAEKHLDDLLKGDK